MRTLLASLLLLLFWVTSGCVEPTPTLPPAPSETRTRFAPGDTFEVRVFGEEQLEGEFQVQDDGSIDFPLVGNVKVAGRTQAEVARALTEALADGYLQDPQVTVVVKERENLEVSVLGQVGKPGSIPWVDNLTLVQAISAAGGMTQLAQDKKVRVTRRGTDGEPETFEVSVRAITAGRSQDVPLLAGDIVFVPITPI